MSKTSPSEIDLVIGRNLKLKRIKSGKSLQDLAEILDVSFQQVQKYEKGLNKISSSNLFLLAEFLDAEISYFFKGINEGSEVHSELEEEKSIFEHIDVISEHEITSLIRSYGQIKNHNIRKKMLELIKSLCQTESIVEA